MTFRFTRGVVIKIEKKPSDKVTGDKKRQVRSDAKRNSDALLQAALQVFSSSGVDAPIREIAVKAGVGVGTFYRHFPKRSDLIVAVFRKQVDNCANDASVFAANYAPGEALGRWMQRYADFIMAKRGLAAALYSGDQAYCNLPIYFDKQLKPALQILLDEAVKMGEARSGIEPDDLLRAVANLCMSAQDDRIEYSRRMVSLLVDGVRYIDN